MDTKFLPPKPENPNETGYLSSSANLPERLSPVGLAALQGVDASRRDAPVFSKNDDDDKKPETPIPPQPQPGEDEDTKPSERAEAHPNPETWEHNNSIEKG